jgi:hypothetical protein
MRRFQSPIARLLLFTGLAVLPACKKQAPPIPVTHVPGTPSTKDVLLAWLYAGLEPEGFVPVTPAPNSATYCEHGKVRGVDTLVCEYATGAELDRGMKQVKEGWARVDAHTGVILNTKRTTMVAVDRERREPSGKTISQMVTVFSKL